MEFYRSAQSSLWAAGKTGPGLSLDTVSGTVGYSWGTLNVTNVDTSSNGGTGLDWVFCPAGPDYDGDGWLGWEDAWPYNGSID